MRTNTGTPPHNGDIYVTATCQAGEVSTGGGYSVVASVTEVFGSYPFGSNAWRVYANSNGSPPLITVYVLCAAP